MSSLRLAELEESLELREEIDRLERGEIRNFDIRRTTAKADIIADVYLIMDLFSIFYCFESINKRKLFLLKKNENILKTIPTIQAKTLNMVFM